MLTKDTSSMGGALDILANIAVVVAAGILGWTLLKPGPGPETPKLVGRTVSYKGAALTGDPSAKVALVVFSDFECPYCARFAKDTFPGLVRRYVAKGSLLIAFRNLPLPAHENAVPAANAAWCAGRQGKFWEMHDALFKNQRTLGSDKIGELATGLGLGEPWTACVNDLVDKTEAFIETAVSLEASEARDLGIDSTPTVLVGWNQGNHSVKVSSLVQGARPLADFSRAVEDLLGPLTK